MGRKGGLVRKGGRNQIRGFYQRRFVTFSSAVKSVRVLTVIVGRPVSGRRRGLVAINFLSEVLTCRSSSAWGRKGIVQSTAKFRSRSQESGVRNRAKFAQFDAAQTAGWHRQQRIEFAQSVLSKWPVPCPRQWRQHVNRAQSDGDRGRAIC